MHSPPAFSHVVVILTDNVTDLYRLAAVMAEARVSRPHLRPHLTIPHHLAPADTRRSQRHRAVDPVAYRILGRYHRLVAHTAVAALVIGVFDLDPLAIPTYDLIEPDHRSIS